MLFEITASTQSLEELQRRKRIKEENKENGNVEKKKEKKRVPSETSKNDNKGTFFKSNQIQFSDWRQNALKYVILLHRLHHFNQVHQFQGVSPKKTITTITIK